MADNCAICWAIPWQTLPSEDEEALPHQPSLGALKTSAKTCALCKMIFWAAGCSLAGLSGGIASFQRMRLSSGREEETVWYEGHYSGGTEFIDIQYTEDGAVTIGVDTTNLQPNFQEPLCVDPCWLLGEESGTRPWIFGNWWRSPGREEGLQLIGLGVRFGSGPRMEDCEKGYHRDKFCFVGSFLRVRTDDGRERSLKIMSPSRLTNAPDSPIARIVPGRLRMADSGSPRALKRIQTWMKECLDTHHCASVAVKELPTRVLDLESSQDLDIAKLIEPQGKAGKYVAMSHCWGTTHRITTTTGTISAHLQGIRVSDLPKTFRDAVAVTRSLGISYLWIDSLCIVQDDPADWEIEASKMGSVYRNSYITISALASSDDSSGCFSTYESKRRAKYAGSDAKSTGRRCIPNAAAVDDSDASETPGKRLYRPFVHLFAGFKRHFEGQLSLIYVTPEWMPSSIKKMPKEYLIGKFGANIDPIASGPLSRRCWTLQERLLPERTIHFGADEMYWECNECIRAEDGAIFPRKFPTIAHLLHSSPADIRQPLMASDRIESSAQHGASSDRGSKETKIWPNPWFQIVERYSSRQLTKETDKLPALSGLANQLAAHTKDTYCAGLWLSNILMGLCWTVKTVQPVHMCNGPNHDKSAYEQETKASVRLPSHYRAPSWSWASVDAEIRYHSVPLREDRIVATLVDVQVVPKGKDPCGNVRSGWIKLKAPLYNLRLRPAPPKPEKPHSFTTLVQAYGKGPVQDGSATFDQEPTFPSYALFLDDEKAIILKLKENPNTYIRIGTAGFTKDGGNKVGNLLRDSVDTETKLEEVIIV